MRPSPSRCLLLAVFAATSLFFEGDAIHAALLKGRRGVIGDAGIDDSEKEAAAALAAADSISGEAADSSDYVSSPSRSPLRGPPEQAFSAVGAPAPAAAAAAAASLEDEEQAKKQEKKEEDKEDKEKEEEEEKKEKKQTKSEQGNGEGDDKKASPEDKKDEKEDAEKETQKEKEDEGEKEEPEKEDSKEKDAAEKGKAAQKTVPPKGVEPGPDGETHESKELRAQDEPANIGGDGADSNTAEGAKGKEKEQERSKGEESKEQESKEKAGKAKEGKEEKNKEKEGDDSDDEQDDEVAAEEAQAKREADEELASATKGKTKVLPPADPNALKPGPEGKASDDEDAEKAGSDKNGDKDDGDGDEDEQEEGAPKAPAPQQKETGEEAEGGKRKKDSNRGSGDGEPDRQPANPLNDMDKLRQQIARETKSPALAKFLGLLKMDVFLLHEEVRGLKSSLQDGVRLADDPASQVVWPVSGSMQCILILAIFYFLVFAALAISKAFSEWFWFSSNSWADAALRSATTTISNAPMLCVLFLGTHLRAEQISQGKIGPPPAAELGMKLCTWSVVIETLLVLMMPFLTGDSAAMVGSQEELKYEGETRLTTGVLTLVKGATTIGLYLGFSIVSVMVVMLDTRSLNVVPVDMWDDPQTAAVEFAPPVSVAVMCTVGLAQLFFFIFLVNGILHSMNYTVQSDTLPAQTDRESQVAFRGRLAAWEHCSQACMTTMNLAPMVCVLFMTARLRSVELDPQGGRPQAWCEVLCKTCTVAIVGQVAAIIGGLVCGMEMAEVTALERASPDWDERGLAQQPWQHKAVLAARVGLAVVVQLCAAGICIAILTLAPSEGREGKPWAPALICTLLLGLAYFASYLGLLVTQASSIAAAASPTVSRESRAILLRLRRLFHMAEATVRFAPMLSILFLGVRLRALLMTGFRGSPQCWAQDAMFASTVALLLQLCMVVVAGILSKRVDVDTMGSPKSSNMTYIPGRFALESVKVAALLVLYGGILLLSLSVVLLRPESATCPAYG